MFQSLRSRDTGGFARAAFDELNTPQVDTNGGVINGDATMIFFFPIGGQENDVQTQTERIVISGPATLVLPGG